MLIIIKLREMSLPLGGNEMAFTSMCLFFLLPCVFNNTLGLQLVQNMPPNKHYEFKSTKINLNRY